MHPKGYKKLHRYDVPGHAHGLTLSCHGRRPYLTEIPRQMFLEHLSKAQKELDFVVWANVLMPTHIHLLIWPKQSTYSVATILKRINGPMSRAYSLYLKEKDPNKHRNFVVREGKIETFRFWLRGGGYDRNLYSGKAVHDAIRYIELNPVRKGLVERAEEWEWSSAAVRAGRAPSIVRVSDFKMPPLL